MPLTAIDRERRFKGARSRSSIEVPWVRLAIATLAVSIALAPALAGCFAAEDESPSPAERALVPLAAGAFESSNATFESFDGATIGYSVHKPVNASASRRVPVILHGHGWANPRWSVAQEPALAFLDAGFGVVSISQRGHDDSDGPSRVMDPEVEARDVMALVDLVATWDWVLLDGPGDPRVGATGWSYGGAFQWVTALEETRLSGRTRFDALAPQATWNDLVSSLAANGVPKSAWLSILLGVAAEAGVEVTRETQEGYASTMATGEAPEELLALFHRHSPAWYAENGVLLDVPVLAMQGATDTLFPLNEAWTNFATVLTPEARERSMLVSHRAAHALPVYQEGATAAGKPCDETPGLCSTRAENPCLGTPTWYAATFQAEWFRHHLAFAAADFGPRVQLATHEGECFRFDALPASLAWLDVASATPAGTPIALPAMARVALKLADGPIALAGIPALNATVATPNPDARLFFALGIGASASDVRIAGDQWMPWRGRAGAIESLELAGVVESVPAGKSLFLVVAPFHELHAAHGTRAAGGVVLSDARVGLPIVDVAA